jgi:hypothetical protein
MHLLGKASCQCAPSLSCAESSRVQSEFIMVFTRMYVCMHVLHMHVHTCFHDFISQWISELRYIQAYSYAYRCCVWSTYVYTECGHTHTHIIHTHVQMYLCEHVFMYVCMQRLDTHIHRCRHAIHGAQVHTGHGRIEFKFV